MRFFKILLVAATLFGRLYASQSEVLCKTNPVQEEQAQVELRNKMFPEDKFTEKVKKLLQKTLPHEVISIIAAYAVESWEDSSGIKVGITEKPTLLWGTCEEILPLTLRKTDTMFTWIPKDEQGKSAFVVYDGLQAPLTFPYRKTVFVVLAATIDKTGRSLIIADDYRAIWFWDAQVGIAVGREQFPNEKTIITGLAVSSNNKYLLVSDQKQIVSVFEIKKKKSGLCCGIKSKLFSTTYDATICQGTGIACDACDCFVFIENGQKTEGRDVIVVHRYGYNDSTKTLDHLSGYCLEHEGTVRSVLINREVTRLAVMSDDKDEEQKCESPFYYSCVTLWDLVEKEHLIRWMCKKSMTEEPVRQVAIIGHNALVIKESPKRIIIVHAPEEDLSEEGLSEDKLYEKLTMQFKQKYALSVLVPEKRIEYFW